MPPGALAEIKAGKGLYAETIKSIVIFLTLIRSREIS